jgi:hypothetical protein
MSKKVEEQKGQIISNMPTMKTKTHTQNVRERAADMALTRSGQTLTTHEPKTSRK